MKLLAFSIALTTLLISCGGISKQEANSEGFSAIEKEIKNEFGEKAYFTDLTIGYHENIGNIVNVTVTGEPKSLKMGEWLNSQGVWKQNSELTLEIPEGTEAADFMFQLDDKINLSTLGKLIEKSKEQLKSEKSIENPRLELASIIFPDNGDVSKTEYLVNLQPENGGTTFRFRYQLSGELIKMDY